MRKNPSYPALLWPISLLISKRSANYTIKWSYTIIWQVRVNNILCRDVTNQLWPNKKTRLLFKWPYTRPHPGPRGLAFLKASQTSIFVIVTPIYVLLFLGSFTFVQINWLKSTWNLKPLYKRLEVFFHNELPISKSSSETIS